MAIRLKDGSLVRFDARKLVRDTSFGNLDDNSNDWSSWRIGTLGMGGITSKAALVSYPSLKPLGDYTKIKAFIARKLNDVRVWNGGELPPVYAFEVDGIDESLLIPAGGMSASVVTLLEEAASRGLGAMQPALQAIQGLEREVTVAREIESEARAELEEDPAWAGMETGTENQQTEYEEELRNRVRERQGRVESPTDAEARTIIRGYLEAENPDASTAELDQLVDARIEENQRAGKGAGAQGASAIQRAGAIAAVTSSVVDIAFSTFETNYELTVDIVSDVLSAVAGICATVGAAVGGIAGGVLIIIGLIVEIVAAILDAIREYTISPWDGVDAEWDKRDYLHIVSARLVGLCQCDPAVLGPNLNAIVSQLDDPTGMLKRWIEATAPRQSPYEERVDRAQSICNYLGRISGVDAGVSLRYVRDIQAWLLYVGMKEADVKIIYDWLADSRKITDVIAYQKLVNDNRGTQGKYSTGYSGRWMSRAQAFCTTSGNYCERYGRIWVPSEEAWWQCPCDENDPGSAGLANHKSGGKCHGSSSAEPNIWKGSKHYWEVCQGLKDVNAPHEFKLFPMSDLERLHKYLVDELEPRFTHSDGTVMADAVADAYEGGSWAVGGGDAFARFMAELPVVRFSVPGFDCWAGRGMAPMDFVQWSRQYWAGGHPAFFNVTVNHVSWAVVVRSTRLVQPTGPRGEGRLPVPATSLNADELRQVSSAAFLRAVQSTLASQLGGGGLGGTGGLLVVAGLAGLAAALLARK